MIAGMRSRRISSALTSPTATPIPTTTGSPISSRTSDPPTSAIVAKADSVISPEIDRSTLPPPVVTANICPVAAIDRNAAEASTPDRLDRLSRCVVTLSMIHSSRMPMADQLQRRARRAASSFMPVLA